MVQHRHIPIREDELLDVLSLLRMIERVPDAIPIDIYSRARELLNALTKETTP